MWGGGSDDISMLSWLCTPLCIDIITYVMHTCSGIANIVRIQGMNLIGLCETRLLTQHDQENTYLSPDPFSHERVGSEDETISDTKN